MNKHAQVKMFETLAVLVVFFFLLIFGASFYFKLQENSLHRELERNTQLRSIQVTSKSLHMPELACSYAGVERENCVDLIKVWKFAELLDTDENAQVEYFRTFQYSTVKVHKVYPDAGEWTVYDKPRGEEFTLLQIPILLYEAAPRQYAFGYLEVKVYA